MLALADFRVRFPEFKTVADALIEARIADATSQLDADLYGDLLSTAIGYLAAHMIALSPYGANARLDKTSGNTTYSDHLERLHAKIPASPLVISHCP